MRLCSLIAASCRTKDLKWVREDPNISFYSGASLHNDKGERLGVL